MKTEAEIRGNLKEYQDKLDGLADEASTGNVAIASLYAGRIAALLWVLAE